MVLTKAKFSYWRPPETRFFSKILVKEILKFYDWQSLSRQTYTNDKSTNESSIHSGLIINLLSFVKTCIVSAILS